MELSSCSLPTAVFLILFFLWEVFGKIFIIKELLNEDFFFFKKWCKHCIPKFQPIGFEMMLTLLWHAVESFPLQSADLEMSNNLYPYYIGICMILFNAHYAFQREHSRRIMSFVDLVKTYTALSEWWDTNSKYYFRLSKMN